MSSLNKIRILENDEQKKTNPNSNEAFELGFVDSLNPTLNCVGLIQTMIIVFDRYRLKWHLLKTLQHLVLLYHNRL